MSRRTEKALTTAAFIYGHVALSLFASFVVTRYVIHQLGEALYGGWLASVAFFSFAAMADCGVFAIYPWLVADADGRRDESRLRALIGQGLWMGVGVMLCYAVAVAVMWPLASRFVQFGEAMRGPLLAFVALTAAAYPLRWAVPAVFGLQDAAWAGAANLIQPLIQIAVVLSLTYAGYGLFGLALGTTTATLGAAVIGFTRLRATRGDLARVAPRPHLPVLKDLWRNGLGAWLGALGWLLASSSDLVVLAYLGLGPQVAAYAVTGRLALTLMQLAWALPDSANVGLAHLRAEGDPSRVRRVVEMMVRANLLLIGGVSCLVLAVNPAFVPLWVGPSLFAGETLHLLFVTNVVVLTFSHAVLVPIGVIGSRRAAGTLQLVSSLAQVGLAVALGRGMGPSGVALASPICTAVLVLPVGAYLLGRMVGRDGLKAIGRAALSFVLRWLPVAAASWWAGRTLIAGRGWPAVLAGAAASGVLYLLVLRPMFRELPWQGRIGAVLRRLRII